MLKTFFITITSVYACLWGYNKVNKNFSIENITLKRWAVCNKTPHNSTEERQIAEQILNQPYTYLGKGRQSFVFESQDGKYVLKFIKCQRINVTRLYETFPLPAYLHHKRLATLEERQKRLKSMFTSMSLAKAPLKDLCGVLYVHIQPENDLQKTVELIDRLGFSHHVAINSVPFILQQKAQKVMPTLKKLLAKKDYKGLICRLDQLIDLFVERASRGIINPDKGLLTRNNIGFLDDRAVYIDLGTFQRSKKSSEATFLAKDFQKLDPIIKWLKSHDKMLADSFSQKIALAIQRYKNAKSADAAHARLAAANQDARLANLKHLEG